MASIKSIIVLIQKKKCTMSNRDLGNLIIYILIRPAKICQFFSFKGQLWVLVIKSLFDSASDSHIQKFKPEF